MDRTERTAFAAILTAAAEAFDAHVSATKADTYFRALQDLPLDEIERAVAEIIKTATFFPKPAEIRAHVQGGTVEDRAALAWTELLDLVALCIPDHTARVDDGVLAETIDRMGGWVGLTELRYVNDIGLATARKEFMQIYAALARSGRPLLPRTFIGRMDRHNLEGGYHEYVTPLALKAVQEQRALEAGADDA